MKTFFPSGNCPIREILARLGDKWSLLIIITLNANGTMRFSDIHKSIDDISERMLSVSLRSLETDGLISRKAYPEIPPRVEYRLTESGEKLMPHLNSLVNWALENMQTIMDSRQSHKNGKSMNDKKSIE
ncbi:MAG: helix-turn-helix transcriptional regulator [Prevotellaceae bacterium]|nr:helix-turn-helix transcriptional regulator [Prevotellaceae bacterium]